MTEQHPISTVRIEYDKNGTPTPTERLTLARAMVADMPFAVVPIKATTAMVVAAIERPRCVELDTSDNSNGLFYSAIYRAMIEAAQEREQCYEIAPTLVEIERAICCPSGTCTSPNNCYAEDHTRSYPVQIQDAAKAVAKLYRGD